MFFDLECDFAQDENAAVFARLRLFLPFVEVQVVD